jgi:hypothetical protein
VDNAALAQPARAGPGQRPAQLSNDLLRGRFVVLVRGTEAHAHALKEQTAGFMAKQMRLTLSPEKTAITHVDDGCELLGFRIKRAPR